MFLDLDSCFFVFLDLDSYFFVEGSLHLDVSYVEGALNQLIPQISKWLSHIEELSGSQVVQVVRAYIEELRGSPQVGSSVRN